jgi:hypothetical protein
MILCSIHASSAIACKFITDVFLLSLLYFLTRYVLVHTAGNQYAYVESDLTRHSRQLNIIANHRLTPAKRAKEFMRYYTSEDL